MNLYKYAAILCVFDDPLDGKIAVNKNDIIKFKKSLGSTSRVKGLSIQSLDRITNYIFSPYDDSVYFEFIFDGKGIDTENGKEQKITIEFICEFNISDFSRSTVKRNIIFNWSGEILQRTIPQERWM